MITDIECQQVWQEISNYIEGDLDAELRSRVERHLNECRPCAAVLEGAQNVIRLVGEKRAFQVPVGFSERLYQRVAAEIAEEERRIVESVDTTRNHGRK